MPVKIRHEWRDQVGQPINEQAYEHPEPEQRVQVILADFLPLDNCGAETEFVQEIHQSRVDTAHAEQAVVFRQEHARHGDGQHPTE